MDEFKPKEKEALRELLKELKSGKVMKAKTIEVNGFRIFISHKGYDKIRVRESTARIQAKRKAEGKCVTCGSSALEYKDEYRKIKYSQCNECREKDKSRKKKKRYHGNYIEVKK